MKRSSYLFGWTIWTFTFVILILLVPEAYAGICDTFDKDKGFCEDFTGGSYNNSFILLGGTATHAGGKITVTGSNAWNTNYIRTDEDKRAIYPYNYTVVWNCTVPNAASEFLLGTYSDSVYMGYYFRDANILNYYWNDDYGGTAGTTYSNSYLAGNKRISVYVMNGAANFSTNRTDAYGGTDGAISNTFVETDMYTNAAVMECYWIKGFNGTIEPTTSGGAEAGVNINITEVKPVINQKLNTNNVSFNASVAMTNVSNCSLFIDYTLNQTWLDVPANPSYFLNFYIHYATNSEATRKTFYLNCSDTTTVGFSNATNYTIDFTVANVSINGENSFSPINMSRVNNYGDYMPINISFIDDSGISSANTLIYYANKTLLVNDTNTSATADINITYNKNISIFGSEHGIYNATFKLYDGINYKEYGYSWYRGDYHYSNDSLYYTGSLIPFYMNVSYNANYQKNLTARFFYNNTELAVNKSIIGDYAVFISNITVGSTNGNYTIYNWSWNVTVTQFNLSQINFSLAGEQNITDFTLTFCSETYTTPSLNFTLYNEANGTTMNGDIELSIDYWMSSNPNFPRRYLFTGVNAINYTFCIQPSSLTLGANYTVTYHETDFPQRTYSQNSLTLNNNPMQVPLYLLPTTSGFYVRFRTVNQFSTGISNVQVIMTKLVGSVYESIETQYSDSSGLTTFWVNPDDTYRFEFYKSSYTTATYDLRPTTSEIYNVIMVKEMVGSNETALGTGISFTFTPTNLTLSNQTSYDFGFTLNSSHFDITGCSFRLKELDGSVLEYGDTTFTNRYCFGNLTANTGNNGTIISEFLFNASGITVESSYSKSYSVVDNYIGEFSLWTLIEDIRRLKDDGTGGFNNFSLMLVSLVLIIGITIAVASKSGGIFQPEHYLMLVTVLVFIFCYIGFLTVTIPNINNPSSFFYSSRGVIQQYITLVLVCCVSIPLILKNITNTL